MAYATTSDLSARYDSRTLNQLSNDTNSTSAVTANLQAALDDGASEILTACLQGSIYTASQLTAMVSGGDTQLVRLNCDLAVYFLNLRRLDALTTAVQSRVKAAQDMLDALRQGKRVLNVLSNRNADTPETVMLTAVQKDNLGDITATDFFGGASPSPNFNGTS